MHLEQRNNDFLSISNSTLESILPVQFPNSDLEKDYKNSFFPRRKPAKGAFTQRSHFPDMFYHLANVSATANVFLSVARFIYARLPSYSAAGTSANQMSSYVQDAYNTLMLAVTEDNIRKAGTEAMYNVSSGRSHIIVPSKRFNGGYDVVFSGSPGNNYGETSTAFFKLAADTNLPRSGFTTDLYPEQVNEKSIVDLARGIAEAVNKWVTGKTTKPNPAARDVQMIDVKDRWNSQDLLDTVNGLMRKAGLAPLADSMPMVQKFPTDLDKGLGKYYQSVVVTEPNLNVVSYLKHRKMTVLPAGDENPFDDLSLQLSVNYGLSFAMTLPKEFVAFITQTPEGGAVPLTSLNTWVSVWARGLVRPARAKMAGGSGGDRVNVATMPRYVLSPSRLPEVKARRESLGLYAEETRANEDALYINHEGRFNYCPPASEMAAENARNYEAYQEEALRISFEAGAPFIGSQTRGTAPFFAFSSPDYATKIVEAKQKLAAYAGSLQTYSWDYNCILTSSRSDPDKLTSIPLNGAIKPDNLAVSEYLRKPAADSMFILFKGISSNAGEDQKKARLEPAELRGVGPFLNNSVTKSFAMAYTYQMLRGKVPDVQELIKMSAEELGYTTLDPAKIGEDHSARFDAGLYTSMQRNTSLNVMTNDLQLLPHLRLKKWDTSLRPPVGSTVDPALQAATTAAIEHTHVIFKMMEAAMNDASAGARSNLTTIAVKEGFDAFDDDHYFDVASSNFENIRNLYNYLGGRVFYNAMKALRELPHKEFMLVDPDFAFPNAPYANIVREVMPYVTFMSKYIPDAEKINEEADEQAESLMPDSSISPEDVKLPGATDAFQMFPHQFKSMQTLGKHPRFATLDIAPGGGKCLVGDTLVPTTAGLLTLEEMWDSTSGTITRGFKKMRLGVRSYEEDGSTSLRNTSHVYKTRGVTKAVRLSGGEYIEGLPEHKMLTYTASGAVDFVRLDEQKCGNWMPKSLGSRVFSNTVPEFNVEAYAEQYEVAHVNTQRAIDRRPARIPRRLTTGLSEIFGYLVSEGYSPADREMLTFTAHDPSIMGHFYDLMDQVFKTGIGSGNLAQHTVTVQNISNPEVKKFLRDNMDLGTASFKSVPECIRRAPEKYQLAFLRTLFEGDGSIYKPSKGTGKEKRTWRIEYATISRDLATQVRVMLENIGILCTQKHGKTAYKSNGHSHYKRVYTLVIDRSSHELFAQKIGFVSDRKQQELQNCIAYQHHMEAEGLQDTNRFVHGRSNILPGYEKASVVAERMRDIAASFSYDVPANTRGSGGRTEQYSLAKIARDAGLPRMGHNFPASEEHGTTNKFFLTKVERLFMAAPEAIRKAWYADSALMSNLRDLHTMAQYVWSRVVSVRSKNRAVPCYDLSVPGPHNYAVDGLFGHNTILGLTDIGGLIHAGKIKRPAVICPNGLVRNWIEDMHSVTKGKWNLIPITTQTYRTWGDERLTDLIRKAPINTIFVIGMSFLRLDKYQVVIGNHAEAVSGTLEFCKKFGFDYIIIDESHKAKNMRSHTHKAIKQLTVSSAVKYVRLATGSLVQNKLTDVVGQAAVFGSHIFRTQEEYEAENSEPAGNGRAMVFKKDTAYRARRQLAKFSAVMSFKKKEWAFLLPRPIETFMTISLADPTQADEVGQAHQMMYNAVLAATLEEIKKNKDIMSLLSGHSEDDDDGDDDDSPEALYAKAGKILGSGEATPETGMGMGGMTTTTHDTMDDSTLADLESALRPYLQRLEMMLTDPLGDEFGAQFFGSMKKGDYVSRKVRKIIERIRLNFHKDPWQKGKKYPLKSVVDFDGQSYVLMGEAGKTLTLEDYSQDNVYVSTIEPSKDPRWKPEPYGKVIVFCRYTRSVNAIYRALPPELKKLAVRFSGEEGGDKWQNLEDFRLTPFSHEKGVQILIANEMAISEGHNLQMASRIVRVESPWSPGELDQSSSRIFRPDTSGQFRRENIYLDWIVCNNTMEVAKMGRLISRMIDKAKFDEADNPLYDVLNDYDVDPISMSLETIAATPDFASITNYLEAYQEFARIQAAEFEEMRQTSPSTMFDIGATEMPAEAAVIEHVPYLPGLKSVPDRHGYGLRKLTTYLQDDEDEEVAAINANKKLLEGSYVHTEFGNGRIVSVRVTGDNEKGTKLSSVTVMLASGDTYQADPAMIYLARNLTEKNVADFTPKNRWATPKDKKRAEVAERKRLRAEKAEKKRDEAEKKRLATLAKREKTRAEKEKSKTASKKAKVAKKALPELDDEEEEFDPLTLDLYPVIYNGYLAVEATPGEDDEKDMKGLGFKTFGDYAFIQIKDQRSFEALYDYLTKKYYLRTETRKRLENLMESFQSGRGRKFAIEMAPIADFKNFYQISHKLSQKNEKEGKMEMKIYPVIINGSLFLNVDVATNPAIRRLMGKAIPNVKGKFQHADGLYIQFFKTRMEVISWTKKIRKDGVEITNFDDFKEAVDGLGEKLKYIQKHAK